MITKIQKLKLTYILVDFLLLNAGLLSCIIIKYHTLNSEIWPVLSIFNFSWLLVLLITGSSKYSFQGASRQRFRTQRINLFVFLAIVSIFIFLFKLNYFSRFVVFTTLIIFFSGKLIINYFICYQSKKITSKSQVKKMLVLGNGNLGFEIYQMIKNNSDIGYQIVGYLDDNHDNKHPEIKKLLLGKSSDLPNILENYDIDEIVMTYPISEEKKINIAIELADFYGIRIRFIPDYLRLLNRRYKIDSIGNLPIINVNEIPLDNAFNAISKRIFDFFFSLTVLVSLFPVFFVLALLIRLESKGPVFYKPVRMGRGGKKFKVYKFRSMIQNDSETAGRKSTVKNDPRITKIGKKIRKYNLDELPQFLNVLKGEMSVVGPRPHRIHLNKNMRNVVDKYMIRHYVKPGITGWAQVNGWRGPTDTLEQKTQRTKHDIWYMENWSFLLDLRIIFLTVFDKKVYTNAF